MRACFRTGGKSQEVTFAIGYNDVSSRVTNVGMIPLASILAQHNVTFGLRYDKPRWWVGIGYLIGVTAAATNNGTTNLPAPNDFQNSTLSQTQHSILVGAGVRR